MALAQGEIRLVKGVSTMHRILLAVDGRRESYQAALTVRDWMRRDRNLEVAALYVTEIIFGTRFGGGPVVGMAHEREMVEEIRGQLEHEIYRGLRGRIQFVRAAGLSVADMICRVAVSKECDTIVLGSKAPRGLWRFLGGGVTQNVLKKAPVSVFVVRAKAADHVRPVPLRGPHQAG